MVTNGTESGSEATDEATGLRVAVVRIHRQFRVLTDSGLTASQASALSRIEELGPLRIGILAEAERTEPAAISRIVELLSKRGFIDRSSDPDDGRASLVQLSARGKTYLRRERALTTTKLRQAIEQLDESQRETVRAAVPLLELLGDTLNRDRAQ